MTKLVYRTLLRLYPWDYANAFSEDMKMAFEEAWEVGKEWLAKLTTEESVRGRSLPDLRKMRPVGIAYEVWFASLDCSDRVKSAID